MSDETIKAGTILLADDEDCLRNLTNTVLTERGYEVIAAANAFEALELAEKHAGGIDLLLTDMRMPDMDGSELACEFRKKYPSSQVIFITAHLLSDIQRQYPGETILPKPFCIEALCELVEQQIRSIS